MRRMDVWTGRCLGMVGCEEQLCWDRLELGRDSLHGKRGDLCGSKDWLVRSI